MMNPWLFWMIWLFLAKVSIVMIGVKDEVPPVTDAEWNEWQEYCREQEEKHNGRT